MSTQVAALTPRPSTFEVMRNNLSKPGNWTYLVPTVGAVAIGAIYVPNFALGLAAGAAVYGTGFAAAKIIAALDRTKTGLDTLCANHLCCLRKTVRITLTRPLIIEGVLRGVIQPLVTRAILWQAVLWQVPAAAATVMGTGLSVAVIISAIAIAATAGEHAYFKHRKCSHIRAEHKNFHIEVIFSTTRGIAYGLLAAQFGIGAAIAAHIANNTLAMTKSKLCRQGPLSNEIT
jgi:hypothetical protein